MLQQQASAYEPPVSNYSQQQYPRQNQLSDRMEQFQREQYLRNHQGQMVQSSQQSSQSMPSQNTTQQQQGYYTPSAVTPSTPTSQTGYYGQQGSQAPLLSPDQMPQTIDPRSQSSGMFTRNLIGSLCVSAFKLTNPEGELGVWFILQDLSVRTEGSFRYRLPLPSSFLYPWKKSNVCDC